MYFYHEGYHDTYYAEAALDDLRSRDRRDDDRSYEPVRIPAIFSWVVALSVALCVVVIAIDALS